MSNVGASASSVTVTTTVEVPVARAFEFFTGRIEAWWDPEHHIIEAPLERVVLEPRVGGRIYDVGADGSECRWARVLAYEPPHRFVFSWDIDLEWKIETDPTRTSEVEVRFEQDGPHRTWVVLEHRHLDRHGDGWERISRRGRFARRLDARVGAVPEARRKGGSVNAKKAGTASTNPTWSEPCRCPPRVPRSESKLIL